MRTDQPQGTPPADSDDDGVVTIRVRRSMVFGAIGLVIGYGLGLATGRFVGSPPSLAAVPVTAAGDGATSAPPTPTRAIAIDGRPSRGPDDAPVTIVEFTDYECPFCRQHFRQTMPTLLARFGDRVRYVIMNYPLAAIHEQAVTAAEAAECAGDQGRFWDYHDALFASDSLTKKTYTRIATTLGLDRRAFAACLDHHAHAERVARHVALGDSLGVTGTPTIFINGRMIDGAQPFPVFQTVIDSVLAARGTAQGAMR